MINELAHQHISTSAKFVTYLTVIFELRNANFLPILITYGTFHCKLVPYLNRVYLWFACNKRGFSEGI